MFVTADIFFRFSLKMAEEQTNEEFNYCDSDEEVFIGNVTDKERAVMAKFGQDFFS